MSKITFTERAFAEYLYWQSQDKKTLKRINALIKDILRSPYQGIGKPERGATGAVFGKAADADFRIPADGPPTRRTTVENE